MGGWHGPVRVGEAGLMLTLREARLQRLLSIRALAKRAGVVPNTVYLVETGQRTPQLLTAYKLSRALGVDPAEIDEFHGAIAALRDGTAAAGRRNAGRRSRPQPAGGSSHDDASSGR